MKRWIAPAAVLIASGVIAHAVTLYSAPSVIMDRALTTLKNRGIALHAFTTPQRIAPQTQAVVRPPPDQSYPLCRYDLSAAGGSFKVTITAWPGYQSLSFFDDATNNFATFRATGEKRVIELFPRDPLAQKVADGENPPTGETWQSTPSERGVALIRRLAPTPELYEAALKASEGDACEKL